MANSSATFGYDDLPPLPTYNLKPLPSLLPHVPDKLLSVVAPIAAYWIFSLFFHWIDTMDYFPQYRLHTPAEVAKRNRATRWEVVRDVVIQQVLQTVVGSLLGMTEPDDMFGREDYDTAIWARRIRMSQRVIPQVLALCGINALQLGKSLGAGHPLLAGALTGGHYPSIYASSTLSSGMAAAVPAYTTWETLLAKAIYWIVIPACQYLLAAVVVDTWQYFLHRAMHMNKWLYTTFHSRHHRLYVPYAYGALYNHPFEGFLLDIIGASLAYKVAGMNTRQGMYFFIFSTLKTIDDHCGYAFPWDPLQHLSGNNAGYHDVHHQSWGIKTNFSQPFSTFWDRLLGTAWTGGDVSARYERARLAAQKAMDMDYAKSITNSDPNESKIQSPDPYRHDLKNATALSSVAPEDCQPQPLPGKALLQAAGSRQSVMEDEQTGGSSILADEAREEAEAANQTYSTKRHTRQRTSSSLSTRESFKGLSQRMSGSTCMSGRGA